MKRLLRWYGAGPLQLLSLLACFGLAGYAAVRSCSAARVAVWFLGAVIGHDLLLVPLYALADRSAVAVILHRAPGLPAVAWINYVRVPAALSGLLLLVWFPLILRLTAAYHTSTTTCPPIRTCGTGSRSPARCSCCPPSRSPFGCAAPQGASVRPRRKASRARRKGRVQRETECYATRVPLTTTAPVTRVLLTKGGTSPIMASPAPARRRRPRSRNAAPGKSPESAPGKSPESAPEIPGERAGEISGEMALGDGRYRPRNGRLG